MKDDLLTIALLLMVETWIFHGTGYVAGITLGVICGLILFPIFKALWSAFKINDKKSEEENDLLKEIK